MRIKQLARSAVQKCSQRAAKNSRTATGAEECNVAEENKKGCGAVSPGDSREWEEAERNGQHLEVRVTGGSPWMDIRSFPLQEI